MAKPTQPVDDASLVWVTLTQTHDLPGLKLKPGLARVSLALRDELRAQGKLLEE